MARTVAISELKAHCLRLVDEVARQRRELVITRRGKPIARVVPLSGPIEGEGLARLRGTLIGGDKLADFETGVRWDAMRR